MRATRWFATICASLATASAHAADGLDLSLRSHALPLKVETVEMRVATPAVPASALESVVRVEPAPDLLRSTCPVQGMCYEKGDRQLFYRGARRYMPTLEGMAAEGISLHHDRLILRYSFR